jgi:hypothetical protein
LNEVLIKEMKKKLDIENFRYRFSAIFWNCIWYFHLNNLDYSFFISYDEKYDKNIKNEKIINKLSNNHIVSYKTKNNNLNIIKKQKNTNSNKKQFKTYKLKINNNVNEFEYLHQFNHMSTSIKNYSLRRDSTYINPNDFKDNSFNLDTCSMNSDLPLNYENPFISQRIINYNENNKLLEIREDFNEIIRSNLNKNKINNKIYSSTFLNFDHHLFKKKKSSQFKRRTLTNLKNNIVLDDLNNKESLKIIKKKTKNENEFDLNNFSNNYFFSSLSFESDDDILKINSNINKSYNFKNITKFNERKSKSLNKLKYNKGNDYFILNDDSLILKKNEITTKKSEDTGKVNKNIIFISESGK